MAKRSRYISRPEDGEVKLIAVELVLFLEDSFTSRANCFNSDSTMETLHHVRVQWQIWHSRFSTTDCGGGGEHPRLTRIILVVEKNGKKRSKAREKWLRYYLSIFSLRSKLWPPGSKYCQFFSFFLSRRSNITLENLHYLGNYYEQIKNGIPKRIQFTIAILSSDLT